MKQIYFLFFLMAVSFHQVYAEPCPDSGTTSAGGTQIIFTYASGSSSCTAGSIVVDGASTFNLASCYDTASVYTLFSGPAISGQDFEVTSGFDTNCSYSSGTLPVDEFAFINQNLKVYPNPLTKGRSIEISFGLSVKANVSIYNVTGKKVFQDAISNLDKKEIDVAGLTNGIYMLKVSTDSGSTTRKVVIMK